MLTPKPKTAHHKRYHEALGASQKKLDRIEKRIALKFNEAVDPARKHYREVERKASALYERAKAPFRERYEQRVAPAREALKYVRETAEELRLRALRKARREHSKIKKAALEKFQKATGSWA